MNIRIIILTALFPLAVHPAETITWQEAEGATGYKVAWQWMPDCYSKKPVGDFRYSVDVGESNEFEIGRDIHFRMGEVYAIRVISYADLNSGRIESPQSEVYKCQLIEGLEEVTEVYTQEVKTKGPKPPTARSHN